MSKVSKKFIKNLLEEEKSVTNSYSSESERKTKFTWLGFRTEFEEIMEFVLFFGKVTFYIAKQSDDHS